MIGVLYFLVHLQRLAPTVIARDLALSFSADAMLLGVIASSYFYLYALAQPVVGYLSDTAGPRKVIAFSFLLTSLGTLLFALAPSATVATAGRALVGFGAGGSSSPVSRSFPAGTGWTSLPS
jgi:MFS family permease